MEEIINGHEPGLDQLLEPLKTSERYAHLMSGAWPGFPPTDLELALQPDRFSFAMPAIRSHGYLTVTAQPV
jgi:hypothetical protein